MEALLLPGLGLSGVDWVVTLSVLVSKAVWGGSVVSSRAGARAGVEVGAGVEVEAGLVVVGQLAVGSRVSGLGQYVERMLSRTEPAVRLIEVTRPRSLLSVQNTGKGTPQRPFMSVI